MRIVIADDHPVILVGLRALLEGIGGDWKVVGEAHNGVALLDLLGKCSCDLLVTDFSMPVAGSSTDGLNLIRHLRERHPELQIVILTMSHNPSLVKGMLTAGAQAVVEKSSMTKELTQAVQIAGMGRSYVSGNLRGKLAEGDTHGAAHRNRASHAGHTLSVREAEIVRMIARGLKVSEIARVTSRSIKTISQQKHDAMRKLCIDSDSQLFEYMRMHGL